MAERLSKGFRKHLRRELAEARKSGDPQKIAQAEQNAARIRQPNVYSLEWFDEKYAAMLRRRKELIIQGKSREADAFFAEMKDQFDARLREHPNIRTAYYSIVGVDVMTRSEVNRFGLIAKQVDGNADTIRFLNSK